MAPLKRPSPTLLRVCHFPGKPKPIVALFKLLGIVPVKTKQIHNKTWKETSTHLSRYLYVSIHCMCMIMCMFFLWWSNHILALKTCLNYLDVIKLSIFCEDNSSKGKQNGKKYLRVFADLFWYLRTELYFYLKKSSRRGVLLLMWNLTLKKKSRPRPQILQSFE